MKFDRLQMRILSALFAAVFIFTATMPVYASGDDPFDVYKNGVLRLTEKFCDSCDITFDALGDLYDDFCSGLDAAVLTGKSVAEATAYLAKGFINFLRQNFLFGKTETMTGLHPDFHFGNKPSDAYDRIFNNNSYTDPGEDESYDISDFVGNYPFTSDGIASELNSKWIFSAYPKYSNLFSDIETGVSGVTFCRNMSDGYDEFFTSRYYSLPAGDIVFTYITNNPNSPTGFLSCHFDGEYFYVDDRTNSVSSTYNLKSRHFIPRIMSGQVLP